jgi:hypothetical protein
MRARTPHRRRLAPASDDEEESCRSSLRAAASVATRGVFRESGAHAAKRTRSMIRRASENGLDPGFGIRCRGTALVPTATSEVSRSSAAGDDGDAGDAQGRIYTGCVSAGGRKVAGSNPAAPTDRKPAWERASASSPLGRTDYGTLDRDVIVPAFQSGRGRDHARTNKNGIRNAGRRYAEERRSVYIGNGPAGYRSAAASSSRAFLSVFRDRLTTLRPAGREIRNRSRVKGPHSANRNR